MSQNQPQHTQPHASSLLPPRFDELLTRAVSSFWQSRSHAASPHQEGARGQVIKGKNLDQLAELVMEVARHNGIPVETEVKSRSLKLPGYFRPAKDWDIVISIEQQLIAVLELKSHVGSLGNNINNRTEEAIGNALDFWFAYAAQRRASDELLRHESFTPQLPPPSFPTAPFLGYLLLLQDCPAATTPISVHSTHLPISPELRLLSYAERYQILCQRLTQHQLYQGAGLILSPEGERGVAGEHRALSDDTSARHLLTQLAAHLRARRPR